ncbi:uncharacterized protein LOC128243812 [Mya arenaria]|uniref:uncharacterized protein LOC128243812 n=1 Tax=Mya arenaria TaxID=6604 RepID=UPI0022E14150|nr:uncharacterized protein LOC128243812 [Mya arenaria]
MDRSFATKLNTVLEEIGVSKDLIWKRRRTFLMRECLVNHSRVLRSLDEVNVFYLGSQSEGTTTVGMMSDTDQLECINHWEAILTLEDWTYGKVNLLVLKDETSPPQYCNLQMFRYDQPLPYTDDTMQDYIRDSQGRILLQNTFIYNYRLKHIAETLQLRFTRHGPARTATRDGFETDFVGAFYCAKLPEECQGIFKRPRPGHWPQRDTLEKAKSLGTFLVAQGSSESINSKLEWRFSTSLIERAIMFDLGTVHLKTFVLLKMIRKTYFKPVVGDRLSTFHFKTALFFTVESNPPDIWLEHNIPECAIRVLTTMHRWLKCGFCPNFTTENVNLFTGKIQHYERQKLSEMIKGLIENFETSVYHITMEKVQDRMLALDGFFNIEMKTPMPSRQKNHCECAKQIFFNFLYILDVRCMSYISAQKISNNTQGRSQMIELYTMEHEYLETLSNHSDDLMRRTFSMLNPFLISLTESVKLAAKIDNHERIAANDIFERFVIPKDPAHISNLLKCASICISCRHFEKATDILNYVEGLIKPYVVQFSGCYQRENPKFNDEFHSRLVEFIDNDEHLLRSSVAMSVKFGRLEIPCVPKHLVFEMYRTFRAVDKTDRHPHNDMWMDAAVVDAIPFLHYLQYVAYRELDFPFLALDALTALFNYVVGTEDTFRIGHTETSWCLLGHCFEMEGDLKRAWKFYRNSIHLFPFNNAANWHILKLLHDVINGVFDDR